MYYHREEGVRGDRLALNNPMRWDYVVLNLPGNPNFDPRLPWVMKWDKVRNNITGECSTFVDDGNCSGETSEHAWCVQRKFTTGMQYRGVQHATRKVQVPGQDNTGSWAGGMMQLTDSSVFKFISKAKWDKTKAILKRIEEEIATSPDGKLNFKQLERD